MKKLALFLCLLPGLLVYAQSTSAPAQPSSWAKVEAQPKGTNIKVKAAHDGGSCLLIQVTADALTCTHKGQDVTYQRADIRKISRPHRGRSALVGLGIGAAAGGIGGAVGNGSSSFIIGRGLAAVIFAVPAGLLGAAVGAGTDFTGSTLYSSR